MCPCQTEPMDEYGTKVRAHSRNRSPTDRPNKWKRRITMQTLNDDVNSSTTKTITAAKFSKCQKQQQWTPNMNRIEIKLVCTHEKKKNGAAQHRRRRRRPNGSKNVAIALLLLSVLCTPVNRDWNIHHFKVFFFSCFSAIKSLKYRLKVNRHTHTIVGRRCREFQSYGNNQQGNKSMLILQAISWTLRFGFGWVAKDVPLLCVTLFCACLYTRLLLVIWSCYFSYFIVVFYSLSWPPARPLRCPLNTVLFLLLDFIFCSRFRQNKQSNEEEWIVAS